MVARAHSDHYELGGIELRLVGPTLRIAPRCGYEMFMCSHHDCLESLSVTDWRTHNGYNRCSL